jgi:hypothetical protein
LGAQASGDAFLVAIRRIDFEERQCPLPLRHVLLTAAVWIACCFMSAIHADVGVYHPEIGKRHPDFKLPAIDDDRPIALSDFQGKKVLLIHFASW